MAFGTCDTCGRWIIRLWQAGMVHVQGLRWLLWAFKASVCGALRYPWRKLGEASDYAGGGWATGLLKKFNHYITWTHGIIWYLFFSLQHWARQEDSLHICQGYGQQVCLQSWSVERKVDQSSCLAGPFRSSCCIVWRLAFGNPMRSIFPGQRNPWLQEFALASVVNIWRCLNISSRIFSGGGDFYVFGTNSTTGKATAERFVHLNCNGAADFSKVSSPRKRWFSRIFYGAMFAMSSLYMLFEVSVSMY